MALGLALVPCDQEKKKTMKMNKVESSPQPNNIALPELKKCLLSFISVFLLRGSLLVSLLVKPDLSPGTLCRNTPPQRKTCCCFFC